MMRTFLLAILVGMLVVVGTTAPAWAEPSGCVEAFDAAQTLRAEGKLMLAREALVRCGQSECPAALVRQCTTWHEEVDRDIPGFVVVATDGQGRELVDVRVSADGELLTTTLTGNELRLDPGTYNLRFEATGHPAVEQRILLRVGERQRSVNVTLGEPPPAPPSPPPPSVERGWQPTPLFWAGLAVTGAGVVVGAVVGGITLDRSSELERQCAEVGCTAEELDDAEAISHVSTVGFAVAGAGAVMMVIGAVLGLGAPADEAVALTARGVRLRF